MQKEESARRKQEDYDEKDEKNEASNQAYLDN